MRARPDLTAYADPRDTLDRLGDAVRRRGHTAERRIWFSRVSAGYPQLPFLRGTTVRELASI